MNCSEFRDQHCSFVDDILAGVELVRMQRHLTECNLCAQLDAKIRRSLMVIRSLPTIELSPDFSQRLERRIRHSHELSERPAYTNFKTVAGIGAVASMFMLGYVVSSLDQTGRAQDIVLPPVIAMAQPPAVTENLQDMTPVAPSIVASVSTGIPLWPAALFVEQAKEQIALFRNATRHATTHQTVQSVSKRLAAPVIASREPRQ